MSRAFTYDELPLSHQLMHDNKHPHGNMGVLIGAPDFGLGKSSEAPAAVTTAKLPMDDLHDPKVRHPYPVSAPLPGLEPVPGAEPVAIHDDGTLVRERMHPGIIACSRNESLGQAAKTMIESDVHALVVLDGGRAVGVLSQTDIVMARQGRTADEARAMTVGQVMTEGCAMIDADEKLSVAISEMMKRRIHRLVVSEKDKPVGVLSMTDIVRKLIG